MSPYYEDEYVQLHHGDCREVAGWLGADVLVTDPPYGMAYEANYKRHRKRGVARVAQPIANDETTEARDRALEMWGDRPALVFGRWNVARPVSTRARLIWDRGHHGMGDLSFPWGPSDEEIYVIGDGWAGKRRSSIIRANTLKFSDSRRPDHPTPKPVALMESLIEYAPPGVIADPFAGSGATLIAARNLGRKVIGVELEERYCELIVKRLSQQAFDFSSLEAS